MPSIADIVDMLGLARAGDSMGIRAWHMRVLDKEDQADVDTAGFYTVLSPGDQVHLTDAEAGLLDPDARIALAGLLLRANAVSRALLVRVLDDLESIRPTTPHTLQEALWILFSQKDWAKLRLLALDLPAIGTVSARAAARLSDIAFLCFYRQEIERLKDGEDASGFRAAAEAEIAARQQVPGVPGDRFDIYRRLVDFNLGELENTWPLLEYSIALSPRLCGPLSALESTFSNATIEKHRKEAACFVRARSSVRIVRRCESDTVALVSLDRRYFDIYAETFLRTFASSNPDGAAHFHCINFDLTTDFLELADRIGISIGWSRDDFTGTQEAGTLAGYYAAARYLHLPTYLKSYPNIFVCDVDGLVVKKLPALFRGKPDIRMPARFLRGPRRLYPAPWDAIGAGAVAIRRTDQSVTFVRAVADYLGVAFILAVNEGRRFFYADQNALFAAYYRFRNECQFEPIGRAFSQAGDWRMFLSEDSKRRHISEHVG